MGKGGKCHRLGMGVTAGDEALADQGRFRLRLDEVATPRGQGDGEVRFSPRGSALAVPTPRQSARPAAEPAPAARAGLGCSPCCSRSCRGDLAARAGGGAPRAPARPIRGPPPPPAPTHRPQLRASAGDGAASLRWTETPRPSAGPAGASAPAFLADSGMRLRNRFRVFGAGKKVTCIILASVLGLGEDKRSSLLLKYIEKHLGRHVTGDPCQ